MAESGNEVQPSFSRQWTAIRPGQSALVAGGRGENRLTVRKSLVRLKGTKIPTKDLLEQTTSYSLIY